MNEKINKIEVELTRLQILENLKELYIINVGDIEEEVKISTRFFKFLVISVNLFTLIYYIFITVDTQYYINFSDQT